MIGSALSNNPWRVVAAALVAGLLAGCQTTTALKGPVANLDPGPTKSPADCAPNLSHFGDATDVNGHTRRTGPHDGDDFVGPLGTHILAPAPGRVITSRSFVGGGEQIVIYHGADQNQNHIVSLFAHLNQRFVKRGEYVERNQLIGEVGRTGINMPRDGTPHLHWEVSLNPTETVNTHSPGSLMGDSWPKDLTPVNPNLFTLKDADGRVARYVAGKNYNDREGSFSGFTFPLACTAS